MFEINIYIPLLRDVVLIVRDISRDFRDLDKVIFQGFHLWKHITNFEMAELTD
jgi:hypothetical protein